MEKKYKRYSEVPEMEKKYKRYSRKSDLIKITQLENQSEFITIVK